MADTPARVPAPHGAEYAALGSPTAEGGFKPAGGGTEYARVRLGESLTASFIDADVPHDERYDARFVVNDQSRGTNLRETLISYLDTCDRFDFSVAFVTKGGVESLLNAFVALEESGVPGRFLTSTYQNFNDPEALEKLASFDNIDVRVYQGSMHAKGYFFQSRDLGTVIVGSSNFTQTALTCNKEWNVLFHSFEGGDMFQRSREEFDRLWESPCTVPLTAEWLAGYRAYVQEHPAPSAVRPATYRTAANGVPQSVGGIVPNDMQAHALEALSALHSRDARRALLVSATGTGKTYLAAFEVAAQRPARVLFIAHTSRILTASMKSFERVLGDRYTYGLYRGGAREVHATCVFAMIGTLSRHLDDFAPDAFDYLIIDEAHRTGAAGYLKALDYFTPGFCLGMTATPERTDGVNVYDLFDNQIAYRITLQDALENDMLAPFHYFGIADLAIDDQTVDDPSLFARLTSDERVRHIVRQIETYSIGQERHGLIFCNRIAEAQTLSAKFNALGYRTQALSGADSDAARERAIEDLEAGRLAYLFTVDLFNEGIDIPCLNQIVMLRRTDSAIIFVQQLGRGLRKHPGKTYTLVLDFIGNYRSNFLVPVALTGDRTYNKDTLRKLVKSSAAVLPGASTVSFDRISEERIFRAIDGGKFASVKLLRGEYERLKRELGGIPRLSDFDAAHAVDPLLIFQRFTSYHAFLAKYEPAYHGTMDKSASDILAFVSRKIANGKRADELVLLKRALDAARSRRGNAAGACAPPAERRAAEAACAKASKRAAACPASAAGVLSGRFDKKSPALFELRPDGSLAPTAAFEEALANDAFCNQLEETLNFGLARWSRGYAEPYAGTDLVLGAKYTYEDACRLLGWETNVNAQNIGGYRYDAPTNTFAVFINYEKDPAISDTIKYEDRFTSPRFLTAISKQPRTLESPEIMRLKAWPGNGMRTFLFVRKNKEDKEGKEFYFLGTMHPTQSYRAFTMPNTSKQAVEIGYELDAPVRDDLYAYLTSSIA
ncbi:MAG: DEAD/DEAH box helicase [Eggerthellaceae bacterium]|nr:DEAD/DEAH box helicase [Eggerthellaceae bacterium]